MLFILFHRRGWNHNNNNGFADTTSAGFTQGSVWPKASVCEYKSSVEFYLLTKVVESASQGKATMMRLLISLPLAVAAASSHMWLYENSAPGSPLVHVPAEAQRPALNGDELAAALARLLRVPPSATAAAAAAGKRLPSADVFNRADANVLLSVDGLAEPVHFGGAVGGGGARFDLQLVADGGVSGNAAEVEGEALFGSLATLPAAVSSGGARVAHIAWDADGGVFRDMQQGGGVWLGAEEVAAAVAAAGSADAEAGAPCLREAALLRVLPARWAEQQRRWGGSRSASRGGDVSPDLLMLHLSGAAAAQREFGVGSAQHRAAERVLSGAVRGALGALTLTLTQQQQQQQQAAVGGGSALAAAAPLTAQLLAIHGVRPTSVSAGARRLLSATAASTDGMAAGLGDYPRRRLAAGDLNPFPALQPPKVSWAASATCLGNGDGTFRKGFVDPAAEATGCPPTTAVIAEYQVGLWTAVALIGILYLALAALFDMDVGKDPLLYARFSVGGGAAL